MLNNYSYITNLTLLIVLQTISLFATIVYVQFIYKKTIKLLFNSNSTKFLFLTIIWSVALLPVSSGFLIKINILLNSNIETKIIFLVLLLINSFIVYTYLYTKEKLVIKKNLTVFKISYLYVYKVLFIILILIVNCFTIYLMI